jgi:tetratricopeptide (TPR) repeat protein
LTEPKNISHKLFVLAKYLILKINLGVNMSRKILALTCLTALLLTFISCGPKTIKPESVLDTPDNHYRQGMRLYERGDYTGAENSFNRAKGMNAKYVPAYAGLALVEASKKNFKEAEDYINKGLLLDAQNREVLIAQGRVICMERKGDDWWEKAIKSYDKALKNNPNDSEIWFYKGEAYKWAYKFADAVSAYAKVVENKDDWSGKANAEWELVQKIVRAAPGTKIGSKIALIEKIDRADIAVLFVEELKLPEVLEKKREKVYDTSFKAPEDPLAYKAKQTLAEQGPTDIADHWAKEWIKEIVDLAGMEMYPDHTFHPDELITRAEFALLIQNILILSSGDPSLATKYFGEESHFPDVNSSHPAYNAIVLCIDRGIMKTKMDGSFGLKDNVSGADALLTIRDFQNALRLTF